MRSRLRSRLGRAMLDPQGHAEWPVALLAEDVPTLVVETAVTAARAAREPKRSFGGLLELPSRTSRLAVDGYRPQLPSHDMRPQALLLSQIIALTAAHPLVTRHRSVTKTSAAAAWQVGVGAPM